MGRKAQHSAPLLPHLWRVQVETKIAASAHLHPLRGARGEGNPGGG